MRPIATAVKAKTPGLVFTVAVLLSACSHPKDATKAVSPFEVVTTTDEYSFKVSLPGDPDYLNKHLANYGLKPLNTGASKQGTDAYRFLWTRSSHKPALFELKFFPDGTGIFEASLWDNMSEKWILKRSFPMNEGVAVRYRTWVSDSKFFDLAFDDNRMGLDGAGWVIEVQQGVKYHAVHRWSPKDGFIREFGYHLIELCLEKSDFLPVY